MQWSGFTGAWNRLGPGGLGGAERFILHFHGFVFAYQNPDETLSFYTGQGNSPALNFSEIDRTELRCSQGSSESHINCLVKKHWIVSGLSLCSIGSTSSLGKPWPLNPHLSVQGRISRTFPGSLMNIFSEGTTWSSSFAFAWWIFSPAHAQCWDEWVI